MICRGGVLNASSDSALTESNFELGRIYHNPIHITSGFELEHLGDLDLKEE